MLNFLGIALFFCPIYATPQPHEMAWTLSIIYSDAEDEELTKLINDCFMSPDRIKFVIRHIKINKELLDPFSYDNMENYGLTSYIIETRTELFNTKDYPNGFENRYLPSYEHCTEMININRSVDRHLRDILPFYLEQKDIIISIIAENDAYYRIWDLMRDGRSGYSISFRRSALHKLKELIKIQNLNEFYIDSAYPMHRFQTQPDLTRK